MGTRGYSQLIIDGKILVQQYGQWDHYPTYAGSYLVDFLKDPENVEFLRGISKFVSPTASVKETDDIQFGQCLWGCRNEKWGEINAFVEEEVHKVFQEKMSWSDTVAMRRIVLNTVQKFGFKMASQFLLADRDIGFHIVQLLKVLHELNPDAILKTTVKTPDEMVRPGEMICGVYTIELNSSKVGDKFQIDWLDSVMKRSLKRLPSDSALEKLEKAGRSGKI